MATFLVTATYTAEGMRGVVDAGGTSRVEAVRRLLESVGGTVESFWFGFGGTDAYITVEVPDTTAMAAVSLAVRASGALAAVETRVLLSPGQVDEAARRTVAYRPPGA